MPRSHNTSFEEKGQEEAEVEWVTEKEKGKRSRGKDRRKRGSKKETRLHDSWHEVNLAKINFSVIRTFSTTGVLSHNSL